MMASLKVYIIAAVIAAAMIGGAYLKGYHSGWNAHSAKVNSDYEQQRKKAEIKKAKSTSQINQVQAVTETKYKTIYRDVVKYVKDPSRTVCTFDNEYQRLRQSSLDTDSSISRDESGTVRTTAEGTKGH